MDLKSTNISPKEQSQLASKAVLAQKEYLVLQCNGYSTETFDIMNKEIPASGSWILPEILDRRDVIIEW